MFDMKEDFDHNGNVKDLTQLQLVSVKAKPLQTRDQLYCSINSDNRLLRVVDEEAKQEQQDVSDFSEKINVLQDYSYHSQNIQVQRERNHELASQDHMSGQNAKKLLISDNVSDVSQDQREIDQL